MRKGEALGLHWADVDLVARLLFVRHTLVAVDNSRLVRPPRLVGKSPGVTLVPRIEMPHCSEQYGQCVAAASTPSMVIEGYFTAVPQP